MFKMLLIIDSGINPNTLLEPLQAIVESTASLQTEPITLGEDSSIIAITDIEDEESNDIEDV